MTFVITRVTSDVCPYMSSFMIIFASHLIHHIECIKKSFNGLRIRQGLSGNFLYFFLALNYNL
jgi:hypothetical protein